MSPPTTAVPRAEPPRSQGCQYWFSPGTAWNTLEPPRLRRGQGTGASIRASIRASSPRSTRRVSRVPWNASPANAPSPVGDAEPTGWATVRTKSFGCAATPRVDQWSPPGPRLTPFSAITTRPLAGSVNRQKYPSIATSWARSGSPNGRSAPLAR